MAALHLTPDEEDDEFQDACENIDATISHQLSQMPLSAALAESQLAIHHFFNNNFEEARLIMAPKAHYSMYHSVGNSVFSFLEAMLTFEQAHISTATKSLKLCAEVCQRSRRKTTLTQTLGSAFNRPNYEKYSELEVHAELCSAEALLLRALLTFVEDETLSSLIKGGMKIRTCFNSYKECGTILTQREWPDEDSKRHFESGVRMGVGTFNLMISLLPGRVIKLLEFIGFSGNQQNGMQDLILGSQMDGIRQVLCVMTLLGYHLIVCYVLSHREGDLEYCDRLLTKQLTIYPNGVWFLFFKGRLEFMQGNLNEALVWYKKSWQSQNVWRQFHHLCHWEMLWVNSLRLEWREAELYASYLLENSKWSKTIYSYQKAVIMCMRGVNQLTSSEQKTIEQLMRQVPQFKQRIAGKSLPMEKFACKKAERFFVQGHTLMVPALELMYVWNLFKILSKRFQLAEGVYKILDKQLTELEARTDTARYRVDDRALLLLLKGACLRHMKSPLQAIKFLEAAIALQKSIKEDHYIVPYAIVEIGLLRIDMGETDQAIATLEDAKKNYTGYSLESRLHFRIHTALIDLKGAQNHQEQ